MPARINPFICEVISKLHNIITTVGGEGHIPLEYNCMLYRIFVILKSDTSTLLWTVFLIAPGCPQYLNISKQSGVWPSLNSHLN